MALPVPVDQVQYGLGRAEPGALVVHPEPPAQVERLAHPVLAGHREPLARVVLPVPLVVQDQVARPVALGVQVPAVRPEAPDLKPHGPTIFIGE